MEKIKLEDRDLIVKGIVVYVDYSHDHLTKGTDYRVIRTGDSLNKSLFHIYVINDLGKEYGYYMHHFF